MDKQLLSAELMPVVANSNAMRSVETLLQHLALSNVPVLFIGEKGTGRAYLARQLYLLGKNSARPFVRITAKDASKSSFEKVTAVEPGMIFIDEIAEASVEFQEILNSYLSAAASSENWCRIACSTAENLEEMVSDGKFSSDLYYQLAVLPVHVPALRNRVADIPKLSEMFLSVYSKRYNKNFANFTDEALSALSSAYWTLNVVELESCIERACAFALPPTIEKEDLRLNILSVSGIFLEGDKSLKSAVDQFKKQYISQILAEVRWNQTEAAKVLDIQRTYLSRLIKELHIK
ncbi:MAG: sigma-54-dependent Fis family transcriptional regulator [Spirochaetaceae bacterium]|nr:sigma-54-dependent Fis family transcriptional regulator [Spirochaetaceae bacterium]